MDNLSNMYYLFRLIIEEIFAYLRDIILREFGWLSSEYESSKTHESTRVQRTIFTHPVADFAAVFIICVVLGICVIFSSKSDKDEEECLLVDESNRVNLPEDRTYILPPNLDVGSFRAASGDASSKTDPAFISVQAEEPECFSGKPNRMMDSSGFYNLRQAQSQSTQTSNRSLRRAAGAHEWLIRRTRSGHIYGKYPM